jgi:glycosyltransferase involved in cell wall biosynthesis
MLTGVAMPKVSIIMPVLNGEKYLREALDSVVNQTLRDIEFIVVDAGSTDGTLEILREYADKDSRMRILHSEKRSMGAQYNIGIDIAKGEFIGFVEADDCVALDMFESLRNKAESYNDIDYIKADFNHFIDLPECRYKQYCSVVPDRAMYNRVLEPYELYKLAGIVYFWSGIYRRGFLNANSIRFNETPGAAFQDVGFANQCLMFADRAVYVDAAYYRYREDNDGSSHFKPNAYLFTIDEFLFIASKMNTDEKTRTIHKPKMLLRYFAFFNAYMRKHLYCNDITEELRAKTFVFAETFRDEYESLSFAERTASGLWPPQDLHLFLKDFDLYAGKTQLSVRSDYDCYLKEIKALAGYENVIVCGSRECAETAFTYLLRNGFRKVIVNNDIESAKSQANSAFLIAGNAYEADSLRYAMLKSGIEASRLFCFDPRIYSTLAYELPTVFDNGKISDIRRPYEK